MLLNANAHIWQPSKNHTQIQIWPKGKMPDALPVTKAGISQNKQGLIAGKPVITVMGCNTANNNYLFSKTKNTGAAVIVFPGGGFHGLAIDLEGTEICEWLASQGITGCC